MLGWTAIRLFFCPPHFQSFQFWVQIVDIMLSLSYVETNDIANVQLFESTAIKYVSDIYIMCGDWQLLHSEMVNGVTFKWRMYMTLVRHYFRF